MDFNKLCGLFMLALFFIDCILAGRIGPFAFLSVIAGVSLLIGWHWYFATAKPSERLQAFKFGSVYYFVEVA